MLKWSFRSALLLVVFSFAIFAKAQDSSSMTGVVVDASGAIIPDVVVKLTNVNTGATFTQTTDAKGTYRFLNVPPAPSYTVTFTRAGFSSLSVNNVALTIGTPRTQNATLSAGASESVEVSAANNEVTLNTIDSTIGNNIDVRQLNELPVQDRTNGVSTLFYLQPGVDSATGAVSGARIDQSSVTVDGMDANDIAAGTTFAIVGTAPVDSVEEFKGTVAGLVAGVSTGSGAQFQLVTKNGTNQFHGNINEYHRDTTTTANTYFNNLVGLPRTPLIQNQFGGNIGGPIKRDKLFFFFNFGDSRIIQSSSTSRTVPLASYLAGNVSYINSNAGCTGSSRVTTTPNCISVLPNTATTGQSVTSLDPAGIGFNPSILSFLSGRYPAANDLSLGDGINTGGFRFNVPTPDLDTTYVTRIDYNLSSKHKVFGRFTINRENATSSLPEFATDPSTHPIIDRSYSYVVSDLWTPGHNKVNQFYYGDVISKLSFPNAYNPTGANQYSFSGLSNPYSGNDGQKRRVPIPEVRDDFNWQIGSHNLAMGGTFKFIKTNSNLINNFNFVGIGLQGSALGQGLDPTLRPSVANDPAHTINPDSTALNDYDQLFATALGVIGTISTNYDYNSAGVAAVAGTGGPRAYRYFQTEAYFSDSWKLTSKLSIAYGVRYQLYSVPYEAHGNESIEYTDATTQEASTLDAYVKARLAQLSSATPVLPIYSVKLGGKANKGAPIYQPSYKDFAPRFAISYSPYANGKTVFNAGAGIVYDRTVINAINFLQDQISYLFSNTQVNQFGASTPAGSLAADARVGTGLSYPSTLNPAPAALTVPFTPYLDSTGTLSGSALGETNFIINPKLRDPYSIALNVGVQQELPFHMVMKINYAGRLGRRLLADADGGQVINVPDTSGKSTQSMVQAFAALTTQLRAGVPVGNITSQPWFENVLAPYGTAVGFPDNTNLVAAAVGQLGNRGDISDMLQALAFYSYAPNGYFPGFLPQNVGIPSQFGSNTFLTNQGNSSYNGLLFTLSKNRTNGLKFDFNYTWSHSIDNTSLSANANALFSNSGFICDVLQPRACRGTSDFDVTQEFNSNFIYDLPIGRGKIFASNSSRLLDEAIGGWSLSGIPSYRTGLGVTPYSDAYLASFDNDDPAIFTGNKGDLKTKINVSNGTVFGFAGGQAGANKVLSEFAGPVGLQYGTRNLIRSAGAFTLDAGLAKNFPILLDDKLNLKFRADFFNVLNHPNFSVPALNIVTNASQFGQVTGTINPPNYRDGRVGQFSLRLEF
jgi:hypothetical protein